MTSRVDALVFDLGGVLIDVSFDRAIAAWAAAAGVPAAALAPRFKLDQVFHAHERGEIDDARYFPALQRRFRSMSSRTRTRRTSRISRRATAPSSRRCGK